MQRQINEKKQELLAKEETLRCVFAVMMITTTDDILCSNLESRLASQGEYRE